MRWSDLSQLLAAADRIIERQRRAPTWAQRRAALEDLLRRERVGPAVTDRVLRLNETLVEGARIRGIHFKRYSEPGVNMDVARKGDVIRRFGRDAWAAIPRERIIKSGRREYVSHLELVLRGLRST